MDQSLRSRTFWALLAWGAAWLLVGPTQAQEPAAPAPGKLAALVKVDLPLVEGADRTLKQALVRTRDRLLVAARAVGDAERPIVVLEFSPQATGGRTPFETALSLARFLTGRDMADVKTVAWLPRSVRGHGLLPALACEELLAGAEAEFGEAGVDEPDPQGVSDVVIQAYREVAAARGIVPEAVAVAMVDPSVELKQLETEEGVRFVTADALEQYRRNREVLAEQTVAAAGALARFTGAEGRRLGFVKYLAGDRAAAALALAVAEDSLVERSTLGEAWRPAIINVTGELDVARARQIGTLLGHHLDAGGNWVALRIDSAGGDLTACQQLAQTLAELDGQSVRTVAYVAGQARGGAALVALACDELVVHPEAKLGAGPVRPAPAPRDNRPLAPPQLPGMQPPVERHPDAQLDAVLADLRRSLAPQTGRSWSLLAAMVDPRVELFEYRRKTTGEMQLMSPEAVAQLADADQWNRGPAVQGGGEELLLTGTRAAQLGVANHTVDDFDQFRRLYALEGEPPVLAPNWALELVEALASPGFSMLLLLIGLAALFVEIKTAGLGVGGVVATVCFVLFFWAKYLDQTAGVLEIVLFLTGVVLVLLEVFVVPGFGIFGLAGGLLVLFSLVLASQTFVLPKSEADLRELRRSLSTVAGAVLGLMVVIAAGRKYLPHAPVFNRMILSPPPPEERIIRSSREAVVDYRRLVGRTGRATTNLWPSGKARIDGELVDVIAEGDPIDRDAEIVVVAATGNRVVVRAAETA